MARPAMSKAEMEIARGVWQLGEATSREVFEQLPKKRGIDFTTVQTYLSRLEEKGYLKSRRIGRAKAYQAKVKPAAVIRSAVDEFIDKLFGGDSAPLLRHLIQKRGVQGDDVDSLRKLIAELESEQDEK